jgi:hypothetical protein
MAANRVMPCSPMMRVLNVKCSSGGSRWAHRSFRVIIGVLPYNRVANDTSELGNPSILSRLGSRYEWDCRPPDGEVTAAASLTVLRGD